MGFLMIGQVTKQCIQFVVLTLKVKIGNSVLLTLWNVCISIVAMEIQE